MGTGLTIPALALVYLPVLTAQIDSYWPTVEPRSALAAQIEQESCVSLKSKRCWSPEAELKTDRERGIGLGQITKTAKFDVLGEIKKQYPKDFAGWSWEKPYQAEYQARALVIMDRDAYARFPFAANNWERMGMAFSAYNGGAGGVLQDRRLCAATPGCDPSKWFDNIERTSLKSRTAVSGYGQSFFSINRGYVRAVMFDRRARYAPYYKDQ